MGQVYIQASETYEYNRIKASVYQIFEESKWSEKLFKGAKVFIKANLLMKKHPQDAVTTHPLVVRAIAEYLIEKQTIPVIGDSPAGPYTRSALEGIYRATGMEKVSRETGAELNYNTDFQEVYHASAICLKKFDVIQAVLDSDFIISAAKLKTHGMMTFTGAVKNLFGVIPGLIKAEYHFKLADQKKFAYHLIDIERFIKPDFSIIDAVECMEGNGPSNGQKRAVGLLIGGENPYEVDWVCADITSIPAELIPTLTFAEQMGILDVPNIQTVGFDFRSMHIKPFLLPESLDITFGLEKAPRIIRNYMVHKLKSQPKFIHKKCISCGHCVRNCPPKAISMNAENKPQLHIDQCISCFCCHEVCPADAIDIQTPIAIRLLRSFFKTKSL